MSDGAAVLIYPEDAKRAVLAAATPLLKAMVTQPDLLSLECMATPGKTVLLCVIPHPNDLGIVIGRAGTVAESLRAVLSAVCRRFKYRFYLEISEGADAEIERDM